MNIFLTHEDPQTAAEYLYLLDKKLARKMIVESSQILSYVVNKLYGCEVPHKMQGNKTPALWVMQSHYHIQWLYDYIWELDWYFTENNEHAVCVRTKTEYEGFDLGDAWQHIFESIGFTIYNNIYITPVCLCERSSIIRNENGCSVYEAYRMLLKEKVEQS